MSDDGVFDKIELSGTLEKILEHTSEILDRLNRTDSAIASLKSELKTEIKAIADDGRATRLELMTMKHDSKNEISRLWFWVGVLFVIVLVIAVVVGAISFFLLRGGGLTFFPLLNYTHSVLPSRTIS